MNEDVTVEVDDPTEFIFPLCISGPFVNLEADKNNKSSSHSKVYSFKIFEIKHFSVRELPLPLTL